MRRTTTEKSLDFARKNSRWEVSQGPCGVREEEGIPRGKSRGARPRPARMGGPCLGAGEQGEGGAGGEGNEALEKADHPR